ncbi:hypothetical protein [Stenotrophomonas maltophilia]|uniref:Transmembrane protein n=1 Tax=Stenotrophomonas maltophilia TaxID=40324 RepID=A0A246ID84_STEMA|nr:hypothetical protein [Stenotrophomonas maltophilia]OWQ77979.1 hypothetical protein CEE63_02920 [Stenotrophomonas maltophilia]
MRKKQRQVAEGNLRQQGQSYTTGRTNETAADSRPRAHSGVGSAIAAAVGSLLAIATILGFLLHFAGDVSQTTYLTRLGLEPTSFPQPVDAKVIHGVYVVASEGSELFNDVPWPKVVILLLFATGFLVIAGAPAKPDTRLRDWLMRRSYWVRQPIVALLTLVGLAVTGVCTAALLSIASTILGIAGERFGSAEAARVSDRLSKGSPCKLTEMWRGEHLLGRGEIIITNSNLIAWYDNDQKVLRTTKTDGIELRTPLGPPKAVQCRPVDLNAVDLQVGKSMSAHRVCGQFQSPASQTVLSR